MSNIKNLKTALVKLELEVSDSGIDHLLAYMALLKEWSGAYNLVARYDRNFLLDRHILDSLSIARYLQPGSLLDVGTGAGLPGVPLAIVNPQMDVTLVDSVGKKIRFIRHVKRALKLANIYPLHQRLEDIEVSQPFANITSRAFSSLRDFAKVTKPCADGNTRLLAMKGSYPHQELEELPDEVNVLSVEELTVPNLQAERHLVMMSFADQPTQQ